MTSLQRLGAFLVGVAVVFTLEVSCGPTVRACSPSTCGSGCCNDDGECVQGTELFECGAGGNACARCEANAVCSAGACGLIDGGVYDASFPDAPDGSYNHDAGTLTHDGGTTTVDAGTPDAGWRNPDGGVSFAVDIQPIFDQHCNSCHVWSYSSTVILPDAGQPQCCGARCISPGNVASSVLYGKVSGAPACGDTMPKGGPSLPPFDVESIRLWIAQGAKKN